MSELLPIYCLDTGALINPYAKWYPPDVAPGYWRDLERLVAEGRIIVSEEVRDELRAEDGLRAWALRTIKEWYPLDDDVQSVVTEIMAKYGRLVDSRKNRSRADPFVIATAKVRGATVVTTESYGTETKPQIPFVCRQLGVPCVDVLTFVRLAPIRLA